MNYILGIDIAKQNFVAVLIDSNGNTIKAATTFKNATAGFRKLRN